MVLDSSDYKVPGVGNVNPTQKGTYKRLAGLIIGASLAVWAVLFAFNRGVPFINSLMSRVGLGSGGGSIEVFE